MGWIGCMIAAAGLPTWVIGLALERQVEMMITHIKSSGVAPDTIEQNVAWVYNSYWLAPYLLWIGTALVVLGSALGVIGWLVDKESDNVCPHADRDRYSNP